MKARSEHRTLFCKYYSIFELAIVKKKLFVQYLIHKVFFLVNLQMDGCRNFRIRMLRDFFSKMDIAVFCIKFLI